MSQATTNPLPPRERIMEAAAKMFYINGIRATGIDAIIATADVAKASFYKYFPTKDDLVVEFLQRRDAQWREWLRGSVERLSPNPAGRPLAVFEALHERFSSDSFRGCAFINSIVEMANRSHAAHVAADVHKKQVTAYLTGLLKAAKISGYRRLAQEFMILIDGAIVTALREGRPDAAHAAKRIATLLLAAQRANSKTT
jgi:AcrR family transcriptional regulator